jgi:hypothetical protein
MAGMSGQEIDMGISEWWQGHRELDLGMRAQGWSLADRILAHVVVDVERSGLRQEGRQLLDQEARWFDRHHEAAIRAGQMSAQDWPLLDASDMERLADERQARGWTGGYAEVPPAHLREIADARMEAFETEKAGLRPTPVWTEGQLAVQARDEREMDTPADDDILAARRDAAGRELAAQSPRGIEEEIVDTAVTRELADEVARPSETAMAAQEVVQAETSTGAEMAAEPGGLERSGGIEPGVAR